MRLRCSERLVLTWLAFAFLVGALAVLCRLCADVAWLVRDAAQRTGGGL